MKRVLIESPFAGERDLNLRYARDLMRFCFMRGEAPFASHALYPQCLDDDVPADRTMGIEAGLCWGSCAEKTVVGVDLGISKGMVLGVERARAEGRPVEWVSLQEWRRIAPSLLQSRLFWPHKSGEAMTVQIVDVSYDIEISHPVAFVP